ncbi:hypothetical protein Q3G72_011377 [Acer saccharum]|nr:hypothetical protein Q3G72_011377 [Acer saccharum]
MLKFPSITNAENSSHAGDSSLGYSWFLSSDSPFNRKGFSIVMHDDLCASLACSIQRKGQTMTKRKMWKHHF